MSNRRVWRQYLLQHPLASLAHREFDLGADQVRSRRRQKDSLTRRPYRFAERESPNQRLVDSVTGAF